MSILKNSPVVISVAGSTLLQHEFTDKKALYLLDERKIRIYIHEVMVYSNYKRFFVIFQHIKFYIVPVHYVLDFIF